MSDEGPLPADRDRRVFPGEGSLLLAGDSKIFQADTGWGLSPTVHNKVSLSLPKLTKLMTNHVSACRRRPVLLPDGENPEGPEDPSSVPKVLVDGAVQVG